LSASPFLKWAGGKRSLAATISNLAPPTFRRYFEPFLGAGAVALATGVHTRCPVLTDANSELINCWQVIRDSPEELFIQLREAQAMHWTAKDFLELRELDRLPVFATALSPVYRAVRFIIINKIGFNGLYRENRKGQCNTSYGHKSEFSIDYGSMTLASENLADCGALIFCADYKESFALAQPDDFIYLDPPYVPASKTANFTGYSAGGFSEDHQTRLREELSILSNRGVRWLLSGADSPKYRSLYSDEIGNGRFAEVSAARRISCCGSRRSPVKELLIYNYNLRG
jgi:DNA adenine methylase